MVPYVNKTKARHPPVRLYVVRVRFSVSVRIRMRVLIRHLYIHGSVSERELDHIDIHVLNF